CATELATVQAETVEAGEELGRITARTHAGVLAVCPGCGKTSDWEHSRYVWHVADEAVSGRPVVIDLSVRRLYCENPDCAKLTLVEQIAGLAVRYHRGVEIACRDGASDFAQAITDADPTIAQCMDRWHLWRGLVEAAWNGVAAHSACWAKTGPPVSDGRQAAITHERWHQVHQLLGAGVGLLDCRRLDLGELE
ncbi:transposase family protein, partial [Streptomyces sp. ET3-23]|uniref:transposase family protein n=1 Tax=Streptomyces sp. ET3-23 TaxID=2885643 RepID=UPI001D124DDD